jgi:hypothetical protein
MKETMWQLLVGLLAVAMIAVVVIMLGILRQLGTLLLRFGPPAPGQPDGAGPDPGTLAHVDSLVDGELSILLFLSPKCSLCPPVVEALATVRPLYRELRFVPIVVQGTDAAKAAYAEQFGLEARTDLDHLFFEWDAPGTPFAVGVGRDRRVVTSGIVNSLPQLETLADAMLNPHFAESRTSSPTQLPLLSLGSQAVGGEDLL